MSPITVVVADRRVQRSLCLRLLDGEVGIRVVGEAPSGLEAITCVARLRPRILLLGLSLVQSDGGSLIPALRQKSPHTKIILLTDKDSDARTLEALACGARGYLDRSVLATFLPRAVRVVDAGEAWVPRNMVAKTLARPAGRPILAGMTA